MHCVKCGARYSEDALSCPNCGESFKNQATKKSPYSWVATFLLCLFFGWFGIHRFYVDKIGSGILMVFLTILISPVIFFLFGLFFGFLFGLFFGAVGPIITFIWVIVDLIMILCKKFTDSKGNYIVE